MAQIICPGCGTRMDDSGTPCPTCGFKTDPQFFKKVLQFVVVFAILGALWLGFLLSHTAEKKPGSPMPAPGEDTHVSAP